MSMAERYARAEGTDWREAVRTAHAKYDKTRCMGWLAATGNRPIGGTTQISLAKGAVSVMQVAEPMPAFACDIHPVEP